MKKIILVSVNLFLFSSLTFANSLSELEGKWMSVGYVCRATDGVLKQIIDTEKPVHFFKFDSNDDNKYAELVLNHGGCRTYNVGNYLVDGKYLVMTVEDSMTVGSSHGAIDSLFHNSFCSILNISDSVKSIFYDVEPLVYDGFILNGSILYLIEFEPSDRLVQQCANGTVFQELVQENKII